MSNHTADTVIDEMMWAETALDGAALERWVRAYPQFRQEIMDFAAAWAVSRETDDDTPLPDEDKYLALASAAALRVLRGKNAVAPPASLVALAGGMPQLAQAAGVSVTLAAKLQNRLLRFATLRPALLTRLAAALSCPLDALTAYLQQPPQLPAGAYYKAEERPALPPQQDFADAVRQDLLLNAEQKARLLAE